MDNYYKSIVLIGMPGSGKSTIGEELANKLFLNFVDGDILLEEEIGDRQRYLDENNIQKYLELEESVLYNTKFNNSVISPGGSIVFCEKIMNELKKNSTIIYLNLNLEEIKKRLEGNFSSRGIITLKGSSDLYEIYNERKELYDKYAHIKINCDNLLVEEIREKIIEKMNFNSQTSPLSP